MLEALFLIPFQHYSSKVLKKSRLSHWVMVININIFFKKKMKEAKFAGRVQGAFGKRCGTLLG